METIWGDGSVLEQLAVLSEDNSSGNGEVDISKLLGAQDQHKRFGKTKRIKPKSTSKKHHISDLEKPDDSSKLKFESKPFLYPEDLAVIAHDIMTKAWRKDERIKQLKLKCSKKSTNRTRQRVDLQRLYVEEPPKDSMKTVCDVDPDYFKVIEGKPEKLNIKNYVQTLRDALRTKIVNGYREDDIILLDETLKSEQKMLSIIQENYGKYVDIFEEFLSKDHTSAMQLLNASEEATEAAYEAYEEYRIVAKKLSAVAASLFIAEEKWRNIKIYQKFLYAVSPVSWKATHPIDKGTSAETEDEPDNELNIFGTYRQSVTWKKTSLTEFVQDFYNEIRTDRPPEIYFTTPDQLLEYFHFLETQNLNALLHLEGLAVPMNNVKNGLIDAEKLLTKHIQYMEECIEKLEASISWEEDRVSYFGDLTTELLENQFRKAVMDEEVLNLQVFVEDVYETRIGVNDADLGMVEMMTEIENKYRYELLLMDKTPSWEVATLEYLYFEEEARVMQLAERATKQFAELEKTILHLKKTYAPPYEKPGGKQLKKRSPLEDVPKKIVAPPESLSQKEEEYLEYFTDFCLSTDDPENYGIRNEVKFTYLDGEQKSTMITRSRHLSTLKSISFLAGIIKKNA